MSDSACIESGYSVSTGEWHHIVVVVGPDFNTGYLDGEEMDNRRYNFGNSRYSQFFDDAIAHEKLWLGRGHWDRTTQYFDGAIDELRIYDRLLTADEVTSLYRNTSAAAPDNQGNSGLKISPNPASDHIDIRIPEYAATDKCGTFDHLNIYNTLGECVLTNRIHKMTSSHRMNTEQLPAGIYMLRFGEKKDVFVKE